MTPNALYRVTTALISFDAWGRLENAKGVYVLRLQCTTDQAFAIEAQLKPKDPEPVEIFAVAGDVLALPARAHKAKLRPDGSSVEVALMLLA